MMKAVEAMTKEADKKESDARAYREAAKKFDLEAQKMRDAGLGAVSVPVDSYDR